MVEKKVAAASEIKTQLTLILNYPTFSKSRVISEFLKFIVTKTLHGQENQLKEYVIATEVLGRKSDFNPQTDPIVRIHAIRLRKALDEYNHLVGYNDPIQISIPKGRYVPVFEISKKGKSTELDQNSVPGASKVTKPILAILPFNILNKFLHSEVISIALQQELATEFSRFDEIGVISSFSIQSAIENMQNPDDIAYYLGCDYLISGACSEVSNNLIINIELSSVRTKQILWSDSLTIKDYTSQFPSAYKSVVQKALGRACGFLGLISRDLINNGIPTDYSYLYAVYWHNRYHQYISEESFLEALNAVEAGLAKNPDNAMLNAFHAELHLDLATLDLQNISEHRKLGTKLAHHAVNLDPNCQFAWEALAWSYILNRNKKKFHQSVERMININPNNVWFISTAGFGHICVGDYEKGFQLMSKAYELSPFYAWSIYIGFSLYYINLEEYEEALTWADLIQRKGFLWGPLLRTSILGSLNRKREASESIKELKLISPTFEQRAKIIIDVFILDKALQRKIINGLVKAGVDIEE